MPHPHAALQLCREGQHNSSPDSLGSALLQVDQQPLSLWYPQVTFTSFSPVPDTEPHIGLHTVSVNLHMKCFIF